MKHCQPEALLVSFDGWLPEAPFEHESRMLAGSTTGCNHILCGRCADTVIAEKGRASGPRRYSCKCQDRLEYGTHIVGADEGLADAFVTAWRCGGHPELVLPATVDGIAISLLGLEASSVAKALASPPFSPPGVKRAGFWVARLYNLLADAKPQQALGESVAHSLDATDPNEVASAIGFYALLPWAYGGDRLVQAARARATWFETTPDPNEPDMTLQSWLLTALCRRLDPDGSSQVIDQDILQHLEALLLAGKNPGQIITVVAEHDPAWVALHGATLVERGVARPGMIMMGLRNATLDQIVAVLRPIAAIADTRRAEVLGAVAKHLPAEKASRVTAGL